MATDTTPNTNPLTPRLARIHRTICEAAGGYTVRGNFHDASIPEGQVILVLAQPVPVMAHHADGDEIVLVTALHEAMETTVPFDVIDYTIVTGEFVMPAECVVAVMIP